MDAPSLHPSAGPLQPAIRVILMPKDTNALGTIFGGIILSYIDQAGAVEGHRHVPLPGRLVTVAMREVIFHSPVFMGDLVSFYTETLRVGRTSVTVKVTSMDRLFPFQDGKPMPIMPVMTGRLKESGATTRF